MRPCHNPYGGVNPLIDKMIGNAYDIVKYVASYLKEIRYVAENMESIFVAANGNYVLVTGDGDGSAFLSLSLPTDLEASQIDSISIIAYDIGSDSIYTAGPDTFNFGVSGNEISISIDPGMTDLLTATYKATILRTPVPE